MVHAPARSPQRSARGLRHLLVATAIVAVATLSASPALAASATWSPPVTTTSDQGQTVGAVTAPDGTITMVVESYTTGIMAVSSTDGGASWQTPVALGSGGDYAFRATIGMTSTGLLAIAWVESAADVRTIWIVLSADGGSTWSAPTSLPTVSSYVDDPTIGSSSALGVTVVWTEDTFDKLSSSTTDGGTTWSASTVITENLNSYGTATFAALGENDIITVYQELDGDTALYSIQSRRSTDGGVTWAPAVMVTDAWSGSLSNTRFNPVVSPATGSAVVFWSHRRDEGGTAIFAATSTDNGASWGSVIEIVAGVGSITYFDAAVVDDATAALVWHQEISGGSQVYYTEVELGATSGSVSVAVVPTLSAYADRLPTLTSFGTTRVATWFQEGEVDADTAHRSAVSCDGGATWRAATTIAAGDAVRVADAVVARRGTVVTALWSAYDADLDESRPVSSSIDDPCSVAVPIVDGPELAATGASDLGLAAFLAGFGMLVAGLAALGVRRASARS